VCPLACPQGVTELLTNHWYALQVRPRYESIVANLLKNKGYEIFAPGYRAQRKLSDRIKHLEVPLFPGYVFCHFDPAARSETPVITTPGVLKILGFANKPTPLDAVEMESVRLTIQSKASPRPCAYVSTGARIRITRGPLAGVEGLLTSVNKKQMLVVSLSMLRRSIAVEIERDSVELFDALAPLKSKSSGSGEVGVP
jgi:transcription termination/antitermination protein NusG